MPGNLLPELIGSLTFSLFFFFAEKHWCHKANGVSGGDCSCVTDTALKNKACSLSLGGCQTLHMYDVL